MPRTRRLVIPLPFADVTITVRGSRSGRAMLWYFLFSAALHLAVISGFIALEARSMLPAPDRTPPEIVTLSSAVRIEHRPRPVPAHHPIPRPRVNPVVARAAPAPVRMQRHVEQKPALREEIAKIAYHAPLMRTPTTSAAQLQEQTRAFEETIARARAANNPVAGAASDSQTPQAPKRYTLNITGTFGRPQPEGILYPLKRWIDGGYVYYYVRYLAEYADGTTETGIVPWPIRFPAGADPFARGEHRMPLPGPMPDYVAAADVEMHPLVKNCYDHRYDYCPIAHE